MTRPLPVAVCLLMVAVCLANGKAPISKPDSEGHRLPYGPEISAKSAIIMDDSTGKVLWSKDADTPRFPASTTKIMTGLLLVEHCKPNDIIVSPADIETVKEASMHLKPGERIRAKDMLYGIMLRSANDGCYAVAIHIAGSVEKFAAMMNARAREIGCTHTHFHNPNGLNDSEHTISARDLALVARTAMQNSWFRDVVGTYRKKIDRSLNWHDTWMVNHNKSLRHDPTADGIKTGYTVPAGKCFVGSAIRNGYRLITVVLKSANWQDDNSRMMKWAFDHHQRMLVANKLEELTQTAIPGSSIAKTPVAPASRVDTLVWKSQRNAGPITAQSPVFILKNGLTAPVFKGENVGTLTFTDLDGFALQVPAVALADAPVSAGLLVRRNGSSVGIWAFGVILGGSALLARRKRQRIYACATTPTPSTPSSKQT